MAVALDQALGTNNNSASATITLTTGATVAAGAHIILVCGHFFSGTQTRSVTGTGGLTWAEDAYLRNVGVHVVIFRAHAPSGLASSTALTVTWQNSGDNIIGAGSFTGISTSGTVVNTSTNSASSGAWSTGAISATTGNAVIGGAFQDGLATCTSTPTVGTELFELNVSGQSETLAANYVLSASGSTNLAANWTGSTAWAAAGVEYLADAGGTAVTGFTPRRMPLGV